MKLCDLDSVPWRIWTVKIAAKKKKAVRCAKRIGLPNSVTERKFLKRLDNGINLCYDVYKGKKGCD